MTSTASRSRQPKGVSTGGQFAAEHRAEAAVSLSAQPESVPDLPLQEKLEAGLEHLGLSVDDVPGLEDAWAKHFADLGGSPEMDEVEFAAQVLGSIDIGRHRGGPWIQMIRKDSGDLDDSTKLDPDAFDPEVHVPLIEYHTRNGGGNRECWSPEDCQGDCTGCTMETLQDHPLCYMDQDDSFDCTYANIAFRIPDDQVETALQVVSSEARNRKRKNLQIQADQIARGMVPPWSVMADRAGSKSHDIQRLTQKSTNLQAALRQEVAEASKYQGYMDWLDGKAGEPEGQNHLIAPMYGMRQAGYSLRSVSRREAQEAMKEMSEARAEMADQQEAMDQAQALPEGKLRSWLLDDRPERSYETTERVSRTRVKKVTRSYTPKGHLQEVYDSAQGRLESRERMVASIREHLAEHHRFHSDRATQNTADLQATLDDRAQAWTDGWPGDVRDCPTPDWGAMELVSLD